MQQLVIVGINFVVLVAQSSIGFLHGDCKIHGELSTTILTDIFSIMLLRRLSRRKLLS